MVEVTFPREMDCPALAVHDGEPQRSRKINAMSGRRFGVDLDLRPYWPYAD